MPLLDRDRWGAIVAFDAISRRLSFVAAARDLDLSVSALSRRISQLEARLGTRLLQRTTRSVQLTDAGERYLDRCRALITEAEAMDAAAVGDAALPHGTLRVGLPNLYGQLRIAPLLPEFLARYPDLQLQVQLSDAYVDMVADRIDVAVRIGDLVQGEYIARRLTSNRRHICAAPDYLERHGAPATPRDITRHVCLHFSPLAEGRSWRLSRAGRSVEVAIRPVLSADNAELLRQAALAGRGLALLADFVVGDDLAAGHLRPVLSDWAPAESSVHVVYPAARYLPLRTRAFADFLIERLGTNEEHARP